MGEMAVIVVIIVVVAMYYGFGEMVETGARMASREVKDLERDQKARSMTRAEARDFDEARYKNAVAKNAIIDSYDL